MSRVVIIHGLRGSPAENWFPWLKRVMEERGAEVLVPQMPDPAHPKRAEWLAEMESAIGSPDAGTYFVGHSLGCIAIMRYLERHGPGSAGGAVFVAGFTADLGIQELRESGFFDAPIDWEMIRSRCKRFVAICSDNDQYVDLVYAEVLRKELGAKKMVQPGMGHFGMKELHVALNELLKLMQD